MLETQKNFGKVAKITADTASNHVLEDH